MVTNCPFFAPLVRQRRIDYLKAEVCEIEKHRWLTVEAMVKQIHNKRISVEEYAITTLGLSGWELEDIIGQQAVMDWIKRYVNDFHKYNWLYITQRNGHKLFLRNKRGPLSSLRNKKIRMPRKAEKKRPHRLFPSFFI
jgi:hypothetical protein